MKQNELNTGPENSLDFYLDTITYLIQKFNVTYLI